MILLNLRMKPPASQIQDSLAILEASRPATEGSAGCLEFSITVETNPEGAIHLGERWESEDDIRRHFRSVSFRKILELMEICEKPPDFHLYEVVESAGLEAVDGPFLSPPTASSR
jgi:quinol monooxygenase YgiN